MRFLWVYPKVKHEVCLPVMGKFVGLTKERKRPNAVLFTYTDFEELNSVSDITQTLLIKKIKNALALPEETTYGTL